MPDSLADPQVTVIIPTHADRSDFLLAAIGSVRAQTYTAWSIIVVDNGAAAATTETIRALNDPRIQVVRSAENRGPGGGRNLGIQAAQTPWIAFLDSDDLWKSDFLATVFDYIRQHPVVAMVSARCEWFRTEHNGDREHVQLSRGHKADLTVAERLLREGNFVSTSTVVARTDALRAVGGFDERLSRSEDFARVYRAGRSVANKYLVLYYFERLEPALPEAGVGPRVGFSVSKRLGTAVDRNRVKRVLREVFRVNDQNLKGSMPITLAKAGIRQNKKTTCYSEDKMELINAGIDYQDKNVVVDGNVVTANDARSALQFAEAVLHLTK